MKTTGVMLADHATVREGLLHVLGAGITRVFRDPLPAPLGAMLAMMLQPDDLADLLAVHSLEVTIRRAGAEGEGLVAKAVMTLQASAPTPGPLPPVPVVVPLQLVPITATGVHQIAVSLDGAPVGAIDFEVAKAGEPLAPPAV